MDLGQRYRINSPQVISETIDGETIIINLESGHYFSLNSTGGEIWNDLRAQRTADQISRALGSRYGISPEETGTQLAEFLNLLLREQLVFPLTDADSPAPDEGGESAAVSIPPPAFEKPMLQKYEDMQDLLLLDPIHDVDEMGWPKSNAS